MCMNLQEQSILFLGETCVDGRKTHVHLKKWPRRKDLQKSFDLPPKMFHQKGSGPIKYDMRQVGITSDRGYWNWELVKWCLEREVDIVGTVFSGPNGFHLSTKSSKMMTIGCVSMSWASDNVHDWRKRESRLDVHCQEWNVQNLDV